MILVILVIRNKWFHQKGKWELVLLMTYSCILCSSPSLLFFSEHVFEHINTEVLRGPDRHFLTNIRAYFGKWWNPCYLKTCWLLIYTLYMYRKNFWKSIHQHLTVTACVYMLDRGLIEAFHYPGYMFLKYWKKYIFFNNYILLLLKEKTKWKIKEDIILCQILMSKIL